MNRLKKTLCIFSGIAAMCVINVISTFFTEAIVNKDRFPVMGVDVSHYQGKIDWQKFEDQNVRFAFIKATEGSGHIDEFARNNIRSASETDIKISAYHFFSFDSPGETQAENFMSVVEPNDIDMPPVIDIEYYGDKCNDQPDTHEVEVILKPLLEILENHYGEKPIIYTTLIVYNKYIKEKFSDYPLWIRNVNFEPDFIDFKFWQYSDKGNLYGFVGEEKYIDLNVYNGTESEFAEEFSEDNREVK